MSLLFRPPRVQQPQPGAKLDLSHPLLRGLVFCAIPVGDNFLDLVTGRMSTLSGTGVAASAIRKTIDGNKADARELGGAAGATNRHAFPQFGTLADAVAGPFSLFVEGSLPVNGTWGQVFCSASTTSGNGFALDFDDQQQTANGLRYWANAANICSSGFDSLEVNSEQYRHRVMLTADGANVRFYAKRKLNATVANTTLPLAGSNRTTYISGRYDMYSAATAAIVMVFSRVLSLVEYQMLFDNVWRVIQPVQSNLLAMLTQPPSPFTDKIGSFDTLAANTGWFTKYAQPGGWFSRSLLTGGYAGTWSGTTLRVWDGSTWKTGRLRRWNGTRWVNANIMKWDGKNWRYV